MEALHAILMDDIEEHEGSHPPGWETAAAGRTSWRVAIRPTAGDGGDEDAQADAAAADAADGLELDLVFAHVPLYPDAPPLFRLRAVKGLSDQDVDEATRAVQREVDACAGAAMVYQMVTAAQEWLGARIARAAGGGAGGAGGGEDSVAARKRAEAEEEARRSAARAHGTPVTVASFAAWQKAFEAEMAQRRAAAAGAAAAEAGAKQGQPQGQQQPVDKPTGKQWFLQAAAAAKDGEAVDDGAPELGDDEECDDYERTGSHEEDEVEDGEDSDGDEEDAAEDDDGDGDDDDDDDDNDELLEFAIKRVAG